MGIISATDRAALGCVSKKSKTHHQALTDANGIYGACDDKHGQNPWVGNLVFARGTPRIKRGFLRSLPCQHDWHNKKMKMD
jgi:hypothetical protein